MFRRNLAAIGFIVTCVLSANSWANSFAQVSSRENQMAMSTEPHDVMLESTDATAGITNDNGVLTLSEDGHYFIMAAGQVGGAFAGSVKIWIRLNGEDVPNTNTEQSIADPSFTAVQVCQGVYQLKAGDKVSVAYSVTEPGLGLMVRNPPGEPVVPSMILSVVKLD